MNPLQLFRTGCFSKVGAAGAGGQRHRCHGRTSRGASDAAAEAAAGRGAGWGKAGGKYGEHGEKWWLNHEKIIGTVISRTRIEVI